VRQPESAEGVDGGASEAAAIPERERTQELAALALGREALARAQSEAMQRGQRPPAFVLRPTHHEPGMRERRQGADAAAREIAGAIATARVGAAVEGAQACAQAESIAGQRGRERRTRARLRARRAQPQAWRELRRRRIDSPNRLEVDLEPAGRPRGARDGAFEGDLEGCRRQRARGLLEARSEREARGGADREGRGDAPDRARADRSRERDAEPGDLEQRRRRDRAPIGSEDGERLGEQRREEEADREGLPRDRGAPRAYRARRVSAPPRSPQCTSFGRSTARVRVRMRWT